MGCADRIGLQRPSDRGIERAVGRVAAGRGGEQHASSVSESDEHDEVDASRTLLSEDDHRPTIAAVLTNRVVQAGGMSTYT